MHQSHKKPVFELTFNKNCITRCTLSTSSIDAKCQHNSQNLETDWTANQRLVARAIVNHTENSNMPDSSSSGWVSRSGDRAPRSGRGAVAARSWSDIARAKESGRRTAPGRDGSDAGRLLSVWRETAGTDEVVDFPNFEAGLWEGSFVWLTVEKATFSDGASSSESAAAVFICEVKVLVFVPGAARSPCGILDCTSAAPWLSTDLLWTGSWSAPGPSDGVQPWGEAGDSSSAEAIGARTMLLDRRRCFRDKRREDASTGALVTGAEGPTGPNPPTAAMPCSECKLPGFVADTASSDTSPSVWLSESSVVGTVWRIASGVPV